MNLIKPADTKTQRIIIYILLIIIGLLILTLIIGTIIGIAHSDNEPFLGSNTQIVSSKSGGSADIRVYSGLGRLRIPLIDSSILILSIAFPYPADDIPFTEELAAKLDELKNLASDYFSNLSEENIININEDNAKREILRRFNAVLRLGSIEVLYFNDMMIIDSTFMPDIN